MKCVNFAIFLILLLVVAFSAFGQAPRDKIGQALLTQAVKGWQAPAGIERHDYEISLDAETRRQGKASASLRAKMSNPTSPNNTFLRQVINASDYLNRRVRFSIYAKTDDVERAFFWMQMVGEGGLVMNDDHMPNRTLSGSLDWQRYDLVLDVPQGTKQIVLGISLKGHGQLWVDDLRFDAVGTETPVTGVKAIAEIQAGSRAFIEKYKWENPHAYAAQTQNERDYISKLPRTPVNLDFED